MGRFDGKVIWITGGGSGIGLAMAVELARQGGKVAVSGRRVDKLGDAVAAVQAAGSEALAVACDVTDEASCRAAVEQIVAQWGRLDVAVANAGWAYAGYVSKMSMDDWHRQFDTNFFGALHTVYAALPELTRTRGQVVLTASVAAYISPKRTVAYASTKHALRALGEGLSLELARDGVGVTTLCPGYVESEIAQVDNAGQVHEDRPKQISPLTVPAEVAAKQIARAIAARKVVAPITGHGAAIIWLARLAPWLARKLLAGQ